MSDSSCTTCNSTKRGIGGAARQLDAQEKRHLVRIGIAAAFFIAAVLMPYEGFGEVAIYAELCAFLIPYLIAGWDVLADAARNIIRGHVLDENFLMAVASLGAFALVLFPDAQQHFEEGAAVMLFFQVGEFFEDFAVERTRRSVAALMDVAPEYANVVRDGAVVRVAPEEVVVGETIVVKPGERVPLDGVITSGESQLDTSALTGESLPRDAGVGDTVVSGSINVNGVLKIEARAAYEDSTVARILEMTENAAEKKAHTEAFITRFARYYTPIVVGSAVLLACVAPLFFGQPWADWLQRGLIFLVVSCPCALVISVPLSFFAGIGSASKQGILIKGGNCLEALAKTGVIAFDKTGTLTTGKFAVQKIVSCAEGVSENDILLLATAAERVSTHPIAESVVAAAQAADKGAGAATMLIEESEIAQACEIGGMGVAAKLGETPGRLAHSDLAGAELLVGNARLMTSRGIAYVPTDECGTVLYVSCGGVCLGYMVIADVAKPGVAETMKRLRELGVTKTVMLTGDKEAVACTMARELGVGEYRAELLPQDKVSVVEDLLAQAGSANGVYKSGNAEKGERSRAKVCFVGDGINDAPVIMRADVGISMGAAGSAAAIEAADVVLMDDKPQGVVRAIEISRKTLAIVWQNIIGALGIKVGVLLLAAIGMANMWMAVFADVGVCILAILNAMRCLRA